jgi:uncharacterized protein YdeI (YjbR/CyaY-like superfamily)
MKTFKSVDAYIDSSERWQNELRTLRNILLATPLEETVKWGAPCYVLDGKNVVGLGAFKSYFGLWFHQGALLSDPRGVLINAQEGKTKAQRQWRMTSAKEIKPAAIKAYVKEAIELQKQGKQIKPVRAKSVAMPPELTAALARSAKAKRAFDSLTPGKQREYAEHVSEAKRDATKADRIKKIIPMILAGHGLNDRYRC